MTIPMWQCNVLGFAVQIKQCAFHVRFMTEPNAVANLLAWCSERGFWIDPSIQIISGPCGVADRIRAWLSVIVIRGIMLIHGGAQSCAYPARIGPVREIQSHLGPDSTPPVRTRRAAFPWRSLCLSSCHVIGATSPWFLYLPIFASANSGHSSVLEPWRRKINKAFPQM
ncbi:hypothetical protein B0H16DRAFT_1626263, partial [Mycena metata]